MSQEEKDFRPLSPESEGVPSKKPKAGSSSSEGASPPQEPFSPSRSPAPGSSGSRTPNRPESTSPRPPESRSKSPLERVVAFFKKSPPPEKPTSSSSEEPSPPQGPLSPSRSPAPGTPGSVSPTRPRSASPKSPGSRSKSPLERVVAFFKRSPPPAPPSEGGSPKDKREAVERWVHGGSMSPRVRETELEPQKPGSSKGRPHQKVTFASEGSTGFDPAVDAFAGRGEVYEEFPDEILKAEGINRFPPAASVEDLSSESETSQGGAVASTLYTAAATTDPKPGSSTPPGGPAGQM